MITRVYAIHGAIIIPRDRLNTWAGRSLTQPEIERIANALPDSTLPDVIGSCAAQLRDNPTEQQPRPAAGRQVHLIVEAEATIRELWVATVPEGWTPDTGEALDMLNAAESNVEFVADKVVGEEHDREVIGITDCDPANPHPHTDPDAFPHDYRPDI